MPKRTDLQSILIIGAGPIVIGQACEFDYSGAQACKALKQEGFRVILVNSNPATIMTDPETADSIYIEPINWRTIERIIDKERPSALLPTMGGQTALNTALDLVREGVLEKYGVEMIGASQRAIDMAEDRGREPVSTTTDTRTACLIGRHKDHVEYSLEMECVVETEVARRQSPPVRLTEGLQNSNAMILTTPTVVAVTPPVMAVCIPSRVFPANPRMLTINNGRINIAGAVCHVRCGSDVAVGMRTSDNISISRTGTHAHSNYNLSIRLRRSDEHHREDQTEQRSYRFLQHFPDLHCTLV